MKTPRRTVAAQNVSPTALSSPEDQDAVGAWLSRHRRWILAALMLLAAAIRVGYFLQLSAGPLVQTYQWPDKDMGYYHNWARRICAGDWWSANVPLPSHSWHEKVAKAYLQMDTQIAAELQREASAAGNKQTAEQLLWRRWLGPKQTWQEPLYPYLVALTYALKGPDPRWVFAWQMALGVGGVLLIYLITERHFGVMAAAVAGLLYVLYRPLLMHEGILLRDTGLTLMGLLLVYVTDLALDRRRPAWWCLVGLSLGVAVLLKSVYVPYLLGLLVVLVVVYWGRWRSMGACLAATFLGLLVALAPWIGRNAAVGATLFSVGGGKFAGITAANYNTAGISWECSSTVRPDSFRIQAETGGKLLPAMVAALKTHPGVGSVLAMVWNKFDAMWHWWERPDNVDSYFYQLYAPMLGYLPVTFAVVSPVALVGMILAMRQFTRHIALYLLVLTAATPLLIFLVLARYRLPLAAAAIPFAAYAVAKVVDWLSHRKWGPAGIALACMAGLAFWTDRPLPSSISLYRSRDFADAFNAYYQGRVQQAVEAREWLRAAEVLADYTDREPPDLAGRPPHTSARNAEERAIASILADVNNDCGSLYAQAGDTAAAQRHFARAAQLKQFCEP
jgi:4-amino-4-deoxy-L-arabinose transferase-like glycosyltransferase